MLRERAYAIIVSDGDESFKQLKSLLKGQGLNVWSARTCHETARLLDQTNPELIFTAARLADGTWSDIVLLAETASVPVNVVVVGKHQDVRLYLAAMDGGACDFILPPFESEPVGHVVRVAAESVRRRREAEAVEKAA